MSRLNGEKARSAVQRKKNVLQRDKARTLRAAHLEKVQPVAEVKKTAAVKAEAAPAAPEKPKKTAVKSNPDAVIESLKPKSRAKAKAGE